MSPEYTHDLTPQEVGNKAANLNISGRPENLMELVYWAQRRALAHTDSKEEKEAANEVAR
ncbi:hypothetical protein [Paraburkholderia sp. RL18-085-BIA-A]|uniref:hypothetical protein n=1 Tax=Paraburkholderia sp. RL18-085-BIA-A TaxID=3031633 RepID=UPI0038B7B855